MRHIVQCAYRVQANHIFLPLRGSSFQFPHKASQQGRTFRCGKFGKLPGRRSEVKCSEASSSFSLQSSEITAHGHGRHPSARQVNRGLSKAREAAEETSRKLADQARSKNI